MIYFAAGVAAAIVFLTFGSATGGPAVFDALGVVSLFIGSYLASMSDRDKWARIWGFFKEPETKELLGFLVGVTLAFASFFALMRLMALETNSTYGFFLVVISFSILLLGCVFCTLGVILYLKEYQWKRFVIAFEILRKGDEKAQRAKERQYE